MINNRQNGRRRGRGGPQVRNGGPSGGQDRGNRIDSRARGNAAQLHEKYRNLARDSQTQGDRVMTEYYLQFADHYFRVLSESRSRFEEQGQGQGQPRRSHNDQQDQDFDDGGDGFDGYDGVEGERYDRIQPPQQQRQPERQPAPDRDDGYQRQERPVRQERQERAPRPEQVDRRDRAERPPEPARAAEPISADATEPGSEAPGAEQDGRRVRRGRRERRPDVEPAADAPAERIDVDRLPPAFAAEPEPAVAGPANDGDEPAPKRRRARRPKDDGDSVAA